MGIVLSPWKMAAQSISPSATPSTDTSSAHARHKVYGLYSRYTTVKVMQFNPDTLKQVDTGLTDVHQFDPVLFRANHYTNLGNNASPSVPLFFDFQRQTGFNFGMHQWDIYRYTDENIKYYNTRSPFTDFHYEQGPTTLQYFQATHSQNITPYWNASVNFRKFFSQGYYAHQLADGYNLDLNTWYRSRSRRYMVLASAIWNSFKFQENGGLVNDTFFQTKDPNADHVGMPFVLSYASQELKDQSYNLRQYFYFGTRDVRKANDSDSVGTTFYYPRFFLGHAINVYNMRYAYFDTLQDVKQFGRQYFDTVSTHDAYRFRDISNTFSFGQVEYHNRNKEIAPISILINGYGKHDFILARHPGKDTSFQNAMIGGGISIRSFFTLRGDAAIVLYGYNLGDYSLAGKIEFPFRIAGYNNTIGFGARNQESRPAYLDQNLLSNHFAWDNHFIKTRYYEAEAFLYSDSFHYRITAKYDLVSSLVYYGTEAAPVQANSDLHYFMINLEKDFKLGRLHFNNSLIYQHVLEGDFVRLPDISFRGSYFIQGNLFHNALIAQAGFDVRYNSTYEAYAYMPGISQFFLQNNVRIGNYPYFDAWVSGSISRFRIYFKLEHVTQGLFGYNYFASPHYPFYPATTLFRVGLRWMFYN